MSEFTPVRMVYDLELRRPGCVLLQAVFGATISNFDLHRFNDWLVAPTPGLRMVSINSEEEMEAAIALTNGS